MEFLNKKFEHFQLSIERKIKSSKDSILYNIEHKIDEIKLAIVASNTPRVPNGSAQQLFAAVSTMLPIANLDDFLDFDKALNDEPEKKDALVNSFILILF